jgi:hypothetical protein
MNKATKLAEKWVNAVNKADDARDDFECYLIPIIKALHPKRNVYSFVRVYETATDMYVETHDDRDYDNWNHFTIPLAVLNAKDPLKEAQGRAVAAQEATDACRQAQIKAEIARLQELVK